jgi:hypothetical protein
MRNFMTLPHDAEPNRVYTFDATQKEKPAAMRTFAFGQPRLCANGNQLVGRGAGEIVVERDIHLTQMGDRLSVN